MQRLGIIQKADKAAIINEEEAKVRTINKVSSLVFEFGFPIYALDFSAQETTLNNKQY